MHHRQFIRVPLRELNLRRLWSGIKSSSSTNSSASSSGRQRADSSFLGAAGGGGASSPGAEAAGGGGDDGDVQEAAPSAPPPRSLPLLQVWPSQDSPRAEHEDHGQAFVFPAGLSAGVGPKPPGSTTSSASATTHQHDSGIDSVQDGRSGGVCEGGGMGVLTVRPAKKRAGLGPCTLGCVLRMGSNSPVGPEANNA
ncbi:hypothetical protein FOCC_FOCC007725 [Frankliniella occidentalis]|nr:hypothetical protein FOCC_FOCC007725 [Frankliniella occidentalis]